MKKNFIFCALAFLLCFALPADAQFGNLLNKAKQKLKEKVENKIDQAIDKATDKVVNAPEKVLNGDTESDTQETTTTSKPAKKKANVEDVKSDFVRGSQVIFTDNQTGEAIGEFPSKWNLMRGNAEVAKVDGRNVILMSNQDSWIEPLIKNDSHEYLGNIFTMEFDIMYPENSEGGFEWDFMEPQSNRDDECFTVNWYGENDDQNEYDDIHTGWRLSNGDLSSNSAKGPCISDGDWHHMAVSFNQRALKVYVDGKRVANIPNAPVNPGWVTLWRNGNGNVFIKDVIIAKGAKDLYGQNATDANAITKAMAETGKFVTNNILFETGKADLKAESMVEIMKVAEYMKANPSVRFEVQGHCDNQGSDKVNDPLSQKRSEAIVNALVKLGVDEFNLKAVGKGSHEPVADNSTEEGRAKNRRVEFIKR